MVCPQLNTDQKSVVVRQNIRNKSPGGKKKNVQKP